MQKPQETDYRAGSRGPGCGCKELRSHLTVRVGVMVTLVTRLGSGLALQAKTLEIKYNQHWLKLLSPSVLFLTGVPVRWRLVIINEGEPSVVGPIMSCSGSL